ncbi:MAG TPA: radical SAM family heme chaperone HemW [Erysipelotrichaceae bacterium]|nr:radical SAM family heme chaperone HemW [Erysipelotrichaceae bacterium]HQA85639.1 radical SAM family heme chaperone HemW [Erysipelotrichaceae bacterium]
MIKGLYVHVPFCKSICSYCDFARCKYTSSLADKYLTHLEKELSEIKQDSFYTIYIGGGTPNSLNEKQLEKLLEMLSRFTVEKEYTIEINPESFNREKALLFKKYGINRVSIGVQTFNEGLLAHMGRKHTNFDVTNALKYLDEVEIYNRSIDLIFGFITQTLANVITDLQKAVRLNITHISIYDLEIYPKTIFGMQRYEKLDEDTCFLMYQTIVEFLNFHGYKQYETSNFALGKYQSVHNKLYWKYEDFKGVGLSSSSKIKNIRTNNTSNFVDYLNDRYTETTTRLSDEDIIFEAIMMNLRMNEGIDIKEFDERFNCNILEKFHIEIEKNINKGLLEVKNGYLKTTNKGIFVLNDILVDFMK